jgi:hypothetical protein
MMCRKGVEQYKASEPADREYDAALGYDMSKAAELNAERTG